MNVSLLTKFCAFESMLYPISFKSFIRVNNKSTSSLNSLLIYYFPYITECFGCYIPQSTDNQNIAERGRKTTLKNTHISREKKRRIMVTFQFGFPVPIWKHKVLKVFQFHWSTGKRQRSFEYRKEFFFHIFAKGSNVVNWIEILYELE